MSRPDTTDQTAVELAARVRSGRVSAAEVARAHLRRIREVDGEIGAFQAVGRAAVLAEAEAVKDNLSVAGYPTRQGSRATSPEPEPDDDELVRRLRAAGAVILGKTRLPELGVWGTTDSRFGITRSPRNPDLSAGGSSGGSAAAVAAGMCPVALGNDGLGSIRIPAAACGVFGVKPGAGTLHSDPGEDTWFGLAEDGPLARTVADGALALSVLAGRPEWREVGRPDAGLRIAVSTETPVPGVSPEEDTEEMVYRAVARLEEAGHRVSAEDPPYSVRAAGAVIARWFTGAWKGAEGLEISELEPRTRRHVRLGGLADRLGLVRPGARERWRRRLEPFFRTYDLLLTPTLATLPPPAVAWSERSWSANLRANLRFAPYTAPWNLAGYPAASVPAGGERSGLPVSVQLVAPEGRDALVLEAARLVEESAACRDR